MSILRARIAQRVQREVMRLVRVGCKTKHVQMPEMEFMDSKQNVLFVNNPPPPSTRFWVVRLTALTATETLTFKFSSNILLEQVLPPTAPAPPSVPPPPPPLPTKSFNPKGEGPAFVKLLCTVVWPLAPIWKQLAQIVQGKVTSGEVNCEAHDKFCTPQGVSGFPTLIYYSPGDGKSEYASGRKLEQLKAFVEKASASYGPFCLAANTVARLAAPLLGSPIIYTSASPLLFNTYAIPESFPWAIVALKDRDPQTPSAMYYGSATIDSATIDLPNWLLANRPPTSMELMQDTFQTVMNAPHKPLVVIAAAGKETHDKVAERFHDIALRWRVHTAGTGLYAGRSVVFAWMDADKWEKWMKSMYGLRKGGKDVEDVGVVIADHHALQYYDTDQSGAPIKLTSASIFSALEGGKITPKNSENFVERLARYLNEKVTTIEAYVMNHPLFTVFMLGLTVVVAYLGLRRCLGDNPMHDREHGYSKSGRLD
ncbi:hypothetical protein GGX14DRAFT_645879 [Mycena pura]|uniref:Thioredoxin domain-containing protein n=1 Tax=Mycena pura TaxID=153505 RepID=A0AAD6Y834_9AGAR|nr:hypothetical protein GGX14DRAFT_645879 [Mycena pura]